MNDLASMVQLTDPQEVPVTIQDALFGFPSGIVLIIELFLRLLNSEQTFISKLGIIPHSLL